MHRRRLVVLGCIMVEMVSALPQAHHSIAGAYDSSAPVTIDGIVVEFQFVNPHPFLRVQVTDARGKVVDWRLEMDNRVELADIGMTARTLATGDRIIARGSRGRDNAAGMYVMRLDRPVDGFWYEQVGTTPHIGVRHRSGAP